MADFCLLLIGQGWEEGNWIMAEVWVLVLVGVEGSTVIVVGWIAADKWLAVAEGIDAFKCCDFDAWVQDCGIIVCTW